MVAGLAAPLAFYSAVGGLITTVVSIILTLIAFYYAGAALAVKNNSWGKAALVIIVGAVVAWVIGLIVPSVGLAPDLSYYVGLILGVLSMLLIIKGTYSVGWARAVVIWIVAAVLLFIINIIVGFVVGSLLLPALASAGISL